MEKLQIDNEFSDLAELTEYYYEELGKLGSVEGFLKKSQYKKMHATITDMMFTQLQELHSKTKVNNKVENAGIKEFVKDNVNTPSDNIKAGIKAVFMPFAKLLKRSKPKVEVIEGVQPCPQISSSSVMPSKTADLPVTRKREEQEKQTEKSQN